jgi:acetyl-CoA C-acetyltransferase
MEDAVEKALDSAPCTALDIDLVIVANMIGELVNGQAHLGSIASSLLPHHPPALRVESACGSGAFALHTACAMLESGRAQTVLVVGVEKMTDASVDEVASALMGAADSETDRPCGLTFPGIFGLIANRYMHEYGLTREELSIVSALHHRNALENPFAQFRMEVSPESVSKSAFVSDPLRLLDCSPISDGAAACILSTAHQSTVRLAASQIASDALSLTKRPTITSFSATKDASERALKEAEIKLSDLQFLETHDCFSIASVMNLEDIGFADPGEGIQIYKNLFENKNSTGIQVNKSGGLKACGHPVAATGIKQICDIKKQLTSSGARYGMAHNFGGACATCGVHIVENLSA